MGYRGDYQPLPLWPAESEPNQGIAEDLDLGSPSAAESCGHLSGSVNMFLLPDISLLLQWPSLFMPYMSDTI